MVGLDAAGKTTILYKLKLGENVTTVPTTVLPDPILATYIPYCEVDDFVFDSLYYYVNT
jgi:hypothetical protein